MAHEPILRSHSPPLPPNGFPDEDDPPIPLEEYLRSLHKEKESEVEKSLRERISHSRNDHIESAYEQAKKQYDLTQEWKMNDRITLPGQPLFRPGDYRFSWYNVTYAEEECNSCKAINQSRPRNQPRLPCLATHLFSRCVFCVCQKGSKERCAVSPSQTSFHTMAYEAHSDPLYLDYGQPQSHRWNSREDRERYLEQDRYCNYKYDMRPLNDYRFVGSARTYPQDYRESRNYSWTGDSKRMKNSLGSRSERRSSTVRSEPIHSQLQTTNQVDPIEGLASHENNTGSTSDVRNRSRNQKTDQTAIDVLFQEHQINDSAMEEVNEEQMSIEKIDSTEKTNSDSKEVKHSISDVTPSTPSSTSPTKDNFAHNLHKLLEMIQKDRLRGEIEMVELKEVYEQLHQKYQKVHFDFEKMEKKNDELIRNNEQLRNTLQKAQEENLRLKKENENLKNDRESSIATMIDFQRSFVKQECKLEI